MMDDEVGRGRTHTVAVEGGGVQREVTVDVAGADELIREARGEEEASDRLKRLFRSVVLNEELRSFD